ncbi:hypothetical protein [Dehalobacter sp. MCB1]|uniref:hypothetical protein n=1 Tax=Dehalobacter sp. MCB1 TaxID=1844756 RepID=UPI00104E48B4|nr:hypothetical protein [Dehalobacter sp. MCB1]
MDRKDVLCLRTIKKNIRINLISTITPVSISNPVVAAMTILISRVMPSMSMTLNPVLSAVAWKP